ncbi:MAG: VOC family protein [Pseudomonadota bacterium]
MSTDTLVWCDLSAYRPDVVKRFYSDLFGWNWSGGDYDIASVGPDPVAAIYQMPPKFMDMGMPSFWMSYIAVADVAATVETARAHDGIIELAAEDHALIRDPLGAGFTVHSGLGETAPTGLARGHRHGHGYFCSDLGKVTGFYEALFGWRFRAVPDGYSEILTHGGAVVATAMELPEDVRGKEQYWAVRFSVSDLDTAERSARAAGAAETQRSDLPEGPAVLVFDPDGAALFLVAP